MKNDYLVEAVRKICGEHVARFSYDFQPIFDDTHKTKKQTGQKLATMTPNRMKEQKRDVTSRASC